MTTKSSSPDKPFSDTAITSLPTVGPPAFPRWEDLVEQDRQEQLMTPPARRSSGLFDGILKDPNLLVSDYRDHPEKYGAEVVDLLELLMSGSTSVEQLSESDRRLLDTATLYYFQTTPKKQPAAQAQRARPALKATTQRKLEEERPAPRPGIDVPVTELPAYWWLR